MTADTIPDAAFAASIAANAFGANPADVRRFTTGSHHYVFEVTFTDMEPVVIRIAGSHSRSALIGASVLSRRLRALGVPLPKTIAEDLDARLPYMILERLPGRDLRDQISGLDDVQVAQVAKQIVEIQAIVSRIPSEGRYGYTVDPRDAAYVKWSQVMQESINRSRDRILAGSIFDPRVIDETEFALIKLQGELDMILPIPFLHDITAKNVIVTDTGVLSGIVDVDDLCFGDPRLVVALIFVALRTADLPTRYIDEWMQTAGFAHDKLFRFYVAVFLLDFMSEQGQVFNANSRPSVDSCLLVRLHSEYLSS